VNAFFVPMRQAHGDIFCLLLAGQIAAEGLEVGGLDTVPKWRHSRARVHLAGIFDIGRQPLRRVPGVRSYMAEVRPPASSLPAQTMAASAAVSLIDVEFHVIVNKGCRIAGIA